MSDDNHELPPPHPMRLIFASNAAIAAILSAHPLDLVKSRMQVMSFHCRNVCYRNAWQCFRKILRTTGFAGLYVGLSAALLRHKTFTTPRLLTYTFLSEYYSLVQKHEPDFRMKINIGVLAGITAALLGTPADLALTRMTTDGVMCPHRRRNYKNVFNAIGRIAKEEGVRSLWRGFIPTTLRAVITTTAQIASYSQYKSLLQTNYSLSEGFPLCFLASMGSGVTNAILTLPVDLVKTRLQQQVPVSGRLHYCNAFDVLRYVIRCEGPLSFWSGFLPYTIRVAPATFVAFIVMEEQHRLYTKYIFRVKDPP